MNIIHGVLGLFGFVLLAVLLSENRKQIKFKVIVFGLVAQVLLAILLSKVHIFIDVFSEINSAVLALNKATLQGTAFVFGYVGGGTVPFKLNGHGSTFSLAFQAMPLVIVISALSSILFYLRILPVVIRAISFVVSKALNIGGALAVGLSANLFIGMAESPLVIRPYMKLLTRSELFTLMTCGMAGVAGTVMALYVIILSPIIHGVMAHVISSVLISLPAVVMISRIIVPETEKETAGSGVYVEKSLSMLDSMMKGVKVGGEVFVSILAMLLVLIAIVAFIDRGIGLLPHIDGHKLSIEYLLGFVFEPFVWLMGIPWQQAHVAGQLMATRLVLNELVSFSHMAALPASVLSHKSQLMMTYAMTGFANLSGLSIMLATYNVLIPERRKEFLGLGFKSLIAGTICTMMTGTIIGMLYVL